MEEKQTSTIRILAIALLVALLAIVALSFALCSRTNNQAETPQTTSSAASNTAASSESSTPAATGNAAGASSASDASVNAPSANDMSSTSSSTNAASGTSSAAQDAWDDVTDDEPDVDTSSYTESSSGAAGSSSGYENTSASNDYSVSVTEDGTYTSKDEVALYIHTYGHLPSNYISKSKARKAGWESKKGNLDDVLPGMSIGGSEFYNNEGQLPDAAGRTWTECDINYSGGYRGAERIVFSNDGLIFYTDDHYETFEQLY